MLNKSYIHYPKPVIRYQITPKMVSIQLIRQITVSELSNFMHRHSNQNCAIVHIISFECFEL
jgi:hypothetical protein